MYKKRSKGKLRREANLYTCESCIIKKANPKIRLTYHILCGNCFNKRYYADFLFFRWASRLALARSSAFLCLRLTTFFFLFISSLLYCFYNFIWFSSLYCNYQLFNFKELSANILDLHFERKATPNPANLLCPVCFIYFHLFPSISSHPSGTVMQANRLHCINYIPDYLPRHTEPPLASSFGSWTLLSYRRQFPPLPIQISCRHVKPPFTILPGSSRNLSIPETYRDIFSGCCRSPYSYRPVTLQHHIVSQNRKDLNLRPSWEGHPHQQKTTVSCCK